MVNEAQATLHDPDDTESGLSGGGGKPIRLLCSGEADQHPPAAAGRPPHHRRARRSATFTSTCPRSRESTQRCAVVRRSPSRTWAARTAPGCAATSWLPAIARGCAWATPSSSGPSPSWCSVTRREQPTRARAACGRTATSRAASRKSARAPRARARCSRCCGSRCRAPLRRGSSRRRSPRATPTDVVASYGPGEYEVLLSGADPQPMMEKLAGARPPRGALLIGAAIFGKDGRDPDALFSRRTGAWRGERRTSGAHFHGSAPRAAWWSTTRRCGALHALAERVAAGNINVLILGETGVGKEVFAEAIHRAVAARGQPFLNLNCAALRRDAARERAVRPRARRVHRRGAGEAGAARERRTAARVFLDEVGELPLVDCRPSCCA